MGPQLAAILGFWWDFTGCVVVLRALFHVYTPLQGREATKSAENGLIPSSCLRTAWGIRISAPDNLSFAKIVHLNLTKKSLKNAMDALMGAQMDAHFSAIQIPIIP